MKQVFSIVREGLTSQPNGENYVMGRVYLDNVFYCHSKECGDERSFIPGGRYRLITSAASGDGIALVVADVPGAQGVRLTGSGSNPIAIGDVQLGKVRTSDGLAKCADIVQRMVEQIDDAADLGIQTYLEISP